MRSWHRAGPLQYQRKDAVMTSDYLKQFQSLDEIYALIDKNRVDAARAAQAKFHNDMEAAIAAIASIGAIASAAFRRIAVSRLRMS